MSKPFIGGDVEQALNLSLTPPRHNSGMTLHGADGSSFVWEIVSSASGFDASFRVERTVGGYPYAEAAERHTLSRDSAVDWLRVEAATRGFDGREVK